MALRLVAVVILGAVGVSAHQDGVSAAPVLAALLGYADRLAVSEQTPAVALVEKAVVGHWFNPERAVRRAALQQVGDRWTVTIERRLRGHSYIERIAERRSGTAREGESDRTITVRSTNSGDYEWTLSERTALARGRVIDVLRSYNHLYNRLTSGPCTEPLPTPGADAVLRGLARVSLRCVPLVQAGQLPSLKITVDFEETLDQRHHPVVRRFIATRLRPAEATIRIVDSGGHAWLALSIESGAVSLLISRDATPRHPGAVSAAAISLTTRRGPFRVGVDGLTASVTFAHSTDETGLVATFRSPPGWRVPFLVRPVVRSALDRPFLDEGAKHAWTLLEKDGMVFLERESTFSVRPHWLMSWMGGSVSETRADMSGPVSGLARQALQALVRDLEGALARAE